MIFAYSAAGKPLLKLALTLGGTTVSAEGLLDSGSDVNVLPFAIGTALGAAWESRRTTLRLAGTFAGIPAMPLLLMGRVGDFAATRLAFAWCQTDEVPLILGQTNFFVEVDVCFFRSQNQYSVLLKGSRTSR